MQWAGHTSWLLSKFKYVDASSRASRVKHNSIKDREICGHCLMGQFISSAFSNSFCGSHKRFGAQVPFYICNINSYACQNPKSEEALWYLHGFHLMGCSVSSLYQVICSSSFTQNSWLPHHSYIQQKRKDLFYFPNLREGSKVWCPWHRTLLSQRTEGKQPPSAPLPAPQLTLRHRAAQIFFSPISTGAK